MMSKRDFLSKQSISIFNILSKTLYNDPDKRQEFTNQCYKMENTAPGELLFSSMLTGNFEPIPVSEIFLKKVGVHILGNHPCLIDIHRVVQFCIDILDLE